MNRKPTVRIIGDDGRQVQLSVEKLVIKHFLVPNRVYYKTVKSNEVNRVDCYIDYEVYDKMKYKPITYRTIRS